MQRDGKPTPLVAHGNSAEDALVASPEVDGDRLADAQSSVRLDLEGDGVAIDGE